MRPEREVEEVFARIQSHTAASKSFMQLCSQIVMDARVQLL